MKCPSCHAPLAEPAPQCPGCGLTLDQLDQKFGLVPLYSRYFTDRTGKLSARAIEQLRDLLRLFERKFPQILFSVLVVNLGPRFSISEYAFWLMNRARFGMLEAVGPKNFELLLVVDPEGRTAALASGYGLEHYLPEQELENSLAAGMPGFRNGDLARGIHDCVNFMMLRLREIALRLEKVNIAAEPSTVSTAVVETQ